MREHHSAENKALAGSLLLAHPSMRDKNFRRAVVLLSAHDDKGAMGVVLNRPLGKHLGQLNAEFALSPLSSVPLYQGGPVQTEQLLLCAWKFNPDESGFQLMFGLDPNKAIELQELSQNTWVVTPLMAKLMEEKSDETLWRTILTDLNHDWKLLVDEPDDPSLN